MSSRFKIWKLSIFLGSFFFFQIIPSYVYAKKWEDKQWENLLQLQKSFWNSYISYVQNSDFYLSNEKILSPKNEYIAFENALKLNPSLEDDHVVCRFPARWYWYRKVNNISDDNLKYKCEKLQNFRNRMSATGVTVVFSSYYMNNPASSFGHTLIRLEKKSHDTGTYTELLDHGINFGAVTGDAGVLAYTLGGLLGWFYATFDAIPYYYKVREYNDYEFRDLWSYKLDLTQDEVNLLVDHLWELGHAKFDYYFLKENCSFYILNVIEAVRPSLNLMKNLTELYTIPSDTLKELYKNKIVKNISFRPSPQYLFYKLLSNISPTKHNLVEEVYRDPRFSLDTLTKDDQVQIIDAAITLFDLRHNKELLKDEINITNKKKLLLSKRANIAISSKQQDFKSVLKEAPHLGHPSRRVSVGWLKQYQQKWVEIEWRYAFHDLLDYYLSYPENSKLEVGKINIQFDNSKILLNEVLFLDMISLGKFDQFKKSSSWKLKVGQWQTRLNHQNLNTLGVAAGYGLSYQHEELVGYMLSHLELSSVPEGNDRIKLSPGADLGLLYSIDANLKTHVYYDFRIKPWNESSYNFELKWSNSELAFLVMGKKLIVDNENQFGIKFQKYF